MLTYEVSSPPTHCSIHRALNVHAEPLCLPRIPAQCLNTAKTESRATYKSKTVRVVIQGDVSEATKRDPPCVHQDILLSPRLLSNALWLSFGRICTSFSILTFWRGFGHPSWTAPQVYQAPTTIRRLDSLPGVRNDSVFEPSFGE